MLRPFPWTPIYKSKWQFNLSTWISNRHFEPLIFTPSAPLIVPSIIFCISVSCSLILPFTNAKKLRNIYFLVDGESIFHIYQKSNHLSNPPLLSPQLEVWVIPLNPYWSPCSGSCSQDNSRVIFSLFCSKPSSGERPPRASMANVHTVAYEALHDSASHHLWPHLLLLFLSWLNSGHTGLTALSWIRQTSLGPLSFPKTVLSRTLLKHVISKAIPDTYTEYQWIRSPSSLALLSLSPKHYYHLTH